MSKLIKVGRHQPREVSERNHKLYKKGEEFMYDHQSQSHIGWQGLSQFVDWIEENHLAKYEMLFGMYLASQKLVDKLQKENTPIIIDDEYQGYDLDGLAEEYYDLHENSHYSAASIVEEYASHQFNAKAWDEARRKECLKRYGI